MITKCSITRREVFKGIGSIMVSLALWPFASQADDDDDDGEPLNLPEEPPLVTGQLRVSVHLPEGDKLPDDLTVQVKILETWEEVPRTKKKNLVFETELPANGIYPVRVQASGYKTIERKIEVIATRVPMLAYLGPKEWPRYLLGGVEIPFRPLPRLAAVVLQRPASQKDIDALTKQAESHGLRRSDRNACETGDATCICILYFEPIDPNEIVFSFAKDQNTKPDFVRYLRKLFEKYNARVGSVADPREGRVKVIDSQYLIRFPKAVPKAVVLDLAQDLGASEVRESDIKANIWFLQFDDPQNIGRHLAAITATVQKNKLSSGEPNILFQLTSHAFAPAVGSDPWESCQRDHFSRQKVYDAWRYLAAHLGSTNRRGAPSIRVATLDEGITYSSSTGSSIHPDVNAERLAYCYDLFADLPCNKNDIASIGDMTSHGMASYGIISAKTENGRGIMGIASNVSHIAVTYTCLFCSSEVYAQTLEWLGGVRLEPPVGSGASDPIPAAHIISCSHGLEGAETPDSVDVALKRLTCEGRGGLGTVVIYSAGNRNTDMQGENQLATHPHTIGVGNTYIDAENKEVRHQTGETSGSNYSAWLDICANGEGIPSLERDPDAAYALCNGTTPDTGVFLHGKTSAAASITSATAALVLSINPLLTWKQVRAVLCVSARKIDCGNADPDGQWVWRGASSAPSLPSPCTSLPRGWTWFSEWYGYGRLDALRAVKLARIARPKPPPACAPLT